MSSINKLFVIFGLLFIIILLYLWYSSSSSPTIPTNGLKLWLKTDAGVVTSTSGTVSEWIDQSENQIKASMSKEERQPLFVENALNKYPVIRFNGQQSLYFSPVLSPTQFTVLIVGKNSQPNESFSMILGPGGKSPNNQLRWENGSDVLFVGTSNRFPVTISPIGDTRIYHLLSARYDGSTMKVYRDGVLVSSHDFQTNGEHPKSANCHSHLSKYLCCFPLSPYPPISPSLPHELYFCKNGMLPTNGPWTLGQIGAWYSRYFMIGDLAEIVVYDVALTEKDLKSATIYLQNKYNLTHH